jgi:tRNA U34 5-carboxymethylaminomethyl modifying enzyme MnmG/GidA
MFLPKLLGIIVKDVEHYFSITYNLFVSAFDMLSINHDEITVEKMTKALPDVFTQLANDRNLNHRLKIEALYEAALVEQQEEMMEVKRDEALRIPSHMDYTT